MALIDSSRHLVEIVVRSNAVIVEETSSPARSSEDIRITSSANTNFRREWFMIADEKFDEIDFLKTFAWTIAYHVSGCQCLSFS